jgi:hypothetical protein
MPQAPYALVRASINGGAVQTGGITAPGSATVQLSADPAGLAGATQYRWELLGFPAAFTVPAGWSTATDGSYYSTAQTPPVFSVLSSANWGKYSIRLKLNGGGPSLTGRETVAQLTAIQALTDIATAISVASVDGLVGVAYYEQNQFSSRGWVEALNHDLRLIQLLITAGGGGAGVSDHGALSGLADDDHAQYLRTDGSRALTGDQSAGGHKITNLATPTNPGDAVSKAYADANSSFVVAGTATDGYTVKSVGGTPTWAPADAFSITAFAAATPVLEVGATATNPAFTAAENRTPTSLLLTNTDNGESKSVVGTPTSFSSSQSYTKTANNATVTFTITGSDGISPANRSASIAWRPRVFWGVAAHGLNSEAGIEGLSNSALQSSRIGSHSVNATGSTRVYWAAPASYGTPTFTVGGFAGGFSLVSAAISVTNAFGVVQLYQLWESNVAGLGAITVVVS